MFEKNENVMTFILETISSQFSKMVSIKAQIIKVCIFVAVMLEM